MWFQLVGTLVVSFGIIVSSTRRQDNYLIGDQRGRHGKCSKSTNAILVSFLKHKRLKLWLEDHRQEFQRLGFTIILLDLPCSVFPAFMIQAKNSDLVEPQGKEPGSLSFVAEAPGAPPSAMVCKRNTCILCPTTAFGGFFVREANFNILMDIIPKKRIVIFLHYTLGLLEFG